MNPGTLVQYYEDGWRTAHFVRADKKGKTMLQTIPAYKSSPERLSLPTDKVRTCEASLHPQLPNGGQAQRETIIKTAAAKTATTNGGFVPEYTVTTNSKANKE